MHALSSWFASHPWLAALLGGALIGLASTLHFLAFGRTAGISGIAFGATTTRDPNRRSKQLFLLGLLLSGVIGLWILPFRFAPSTTSLPLLAASGLLVGFGTRVGGGCTSGHGVCGLSRGSLRSLVATLTFMATGALAVFVMRHLGWSIAGGGQ